MQPFFRRAPAPPFSGLVHLAARDGGMDVNPSPADPNGVLQMLTWLLLALTALMLVFRAVTRFFLRLNHILGWEELSVFGAFLFGVGESATLLTERGEIFGKHLDEIGAEQLVTGIKAAFSGQLLSILSLGCAKLSVCACLLALSPDDRHQLIVKSLVGTLVVWTFTGLFVVAFQCGSRRPWEASATAAACIDRHAFLKYLSISSVITDAVLVLLPILAVIPLNTPLKTRLTVAGLFGSRVLAIVSTAFQLTYLPRVFISQGEDWTYHAFAYVICTQFVQFASISTACMTYFWPLLRSLNSGLMDSRSKSYRSHYALSAPQNTPKPRTATHRATAERPVAVEGLSKSRDRQDYIELRE